LQFEDGEDALPARLKVQYKVRSMNDDVVYLDYGGRRRRSVPSKRLVGSVWSGYLSLGTPADEGSAVRDSSRAP